MSLFARLRAISLDITVFVSGGLLMTYEIIGSRILAPFIGTSTYVWTSLIGVILASLSLGYWFGGRLADRRPDVRILAAVLFLAGTLVSVTVLVKEIILSFIASAPVGVELQSLLAALLLFAPASVCLGMVTPYAVKLRMLVLADVGKTVGRLYALSTVGSIAGTFLAGFFLIPFVGSVRTLYIIAGSLIALSLLLVPFAISRINIAGLVLLFCAVCWSEAAAGISFRANELRDIDTEYSRVQVFRSTDRNGRAIRVLTTDPYAIQSAIFLDSDEPALEYGRFYHLARHFKPAFRDVLVVGGAGYSTPKEFLRRYDNVRLDVVEIDPRMTDIAREHFRLKDDPQLNIIHEDGRMYLNRADAGRYDVILMDAFGSMFTVPFQLTTVEAVQKIHNSLTDDGVVIFNLGSSITGPGSGFFRAEMATYRSVFPNVFVFKVRTDRTDESLQNLIIVALKSSEPPQLASGDAEISALLGNIYPNGIPTDLPVLTDDIAPVEHYNSIAQNQYTPQQ
ncbi:MAG: fused MFS/spermidine synthase [Chloracidobacterium sp.]|nr:fused MFS/spermidine synthase [Chloracidobacterium sp.]